MPFSLFELEQLASSGLCIKVSQTIKCQCHKLFGLGKGQGHVFSVDVCNQLVFSIKSYKASGVIDSKTGDLSLVILNQRDIKGHMGVSLIDRLQVITGTAVRRIPGFMDSQRFQLCALQYISATIQTTLQVRHILVTGCIPLLGVPIPAKQ